MIFLSKPKVFISHAHEDKERFVTNFAINLMKNGVDAWYDQWEMSLGDSLIDKIFEEGIKDCDFFLIILSKNSIKKRWVKEELDSAVVQRIEKSTKLIPIVLDADIDVPVSIKHLFRVVIKDPEDYENEMKNILMTLFRMSEKPEIGEKPLFVVDYDIRGYSKIDSVIIKIIGDFILKKSFQSTIPWSNLSGNEELFEIPEDQIIESLEILENDHIIQISRLLGSKTNLLVKITASGFLLYAEKFVPNFNQYFIDILSAVMNDNLRSETAIVSQTNIKNPIITAVLEKLIKLNYIKGKTTLNGIYIYDITGPGKRYIKKVLNQNI